MDAYSVTDPAKLADVLTAAIASGKPTLVEVVVADGFEQKA
jgi:thiamine pyrophosphate-dependent acetolactate synthase large subunit-like protein